MRCALLRSIMAKWTKKDIKSLCSQLTTFALQNRLYATAEQIAAAIEANRAAIVISGLRSFATMLDDRAAQSLSTAKHFEAHPEIYRASTPEMVERFTRLAAEDSAGAAKAWALVARVGAEGLPAEVLAFEALSL